MLSSVGRAHVLLSAGTVRDRTWTARVSPVILVDSTPLVAPRARACFTRSAPPKTWFPSPSMTASTVRENTTMEPAGDAQMHDQNAWPSAA